MDKELVEAIREKILRLGEPMQGCFFIVWGRGYAIHFEGSDSKDLAKVKEYVEVLISEMEQENIKNFKKSGI